MTPHFGSPITSDTDNTGTEVIVTLIASNISHASKLS